VATSEKVRLPKLPTAEERPLTNLWPDAGRSLGLSRAYTYDAAARGEFPIPVVRVGRWRKVRTRDLRIFLGLD
jgi:hypothetical protein